MKQIIAGVIALATAGSAHAQGSISWSAAGTGSGSQGYLSYIDFQGEYTTVTDGIASASFLLNFTNERPTTAQLSESLVSLDGESSITNSVYGENYENSPYEGVYFSGGYQSGQATVIYREPAANGFFSENYFYDRQSNGKYTITGSGYYWFQGGPGEYTYNSNWVMNDVSISFVGAPVPEPRQWALMIGGFGLAGVATRRRSGKVAFAR